MSSTFESLDLLTSAGKLFEKKENGEIICLACAHRCLIRPGKRGICKIRFNREGNLKVPWGYVVSANTDPIEKKPFTHFLPGSNVLTFGMLGCNFHCSFCQNWEISQVLTDKTLRINNNYLQKASPDSIVNFALQTGANIIASSYNEPLISSEWAAEIFTVAKNRGLQTAYVSNGYASREVLEYLHPVLDAYKIDLKTMQDRHYRACGGILKNVLDTIVMAHSMGFWVEIVTLVIPGFNDSHDELWEAARFIRSVSADIPWHVTAFHPQYQMTDRSPTPVFTLQKAAEIGQEAGLHYVYAGNLPGRVGSLEDTFCSNCQALLIHRQGYIIHEYNISNKGLCPKCSHTIAGIWTDKPDSVQISGSGFPRRISW